MFSYSLAAVVDFDTFSEYNVKRKSGFYGVMSYDRTWNNNQ